ncbi:hypothetical protein CYMTET_46513, partial [Cymbomonas tetramitiformis]
SSAYKKKQDGNRDSLSLENKLQFLLEDLDALDGDEPTASSRQLDQRLAETAAKQAALTARVSSLPPEVLEERRAEAAAAVSEMINRYRRGVEERRNAILMELGIDPNTAMNADSGAVVSAAYDHMLQSIDKHEDPEQLQAQSTASLVEKALGRVEAVATRMAEAEKVAAEAAAEARAKEEQQDDAESEKSDDDDDEMDKRSRAANAAQQKGKLTSAGGSAQTRQTQMPGSHATVSQAARASDTNRDSMANRPAAGKTAGAQPTVSAPQAEAEKRSKTRDFMDEPPPSLPDLAVDEGLSLAEALQRRLERVWQLLRMPVMQKLDMVIKYTSKELSHHLEAALACWEAGAAALLERERALTDLEALAKARQQSGTTATSEKEEIAAQHALERATVFLLKADARLASEYDDTLTFEGEPYTQNKNEPGWATGTVKKPSGAK